MKDGIIKGTGNSRYLKTVANALTQYPTYEKFLAAMVAGTFPIDLNGINTAGWQTQGTALNKANLLADATASAIGLSGDPTVNDALKFLNYYKFSPQKVKTLIFKKSGQFTVSNSAKDNKFIVVCQGGGGGGGASNSGLNGGGGGGGHTTISELTLSPNAKISVTIGAGGATITKRRNHQVW